GFPPPAAGDLALAMSPVDCASSELREALARGEDVRDQLPDAVWAIVERERLYGGRLCYAPARNRPWSSPTEQHVSARPPDRSARRRQGGLGDRDSGH